MKNLITIFLLLTITSFNILTAAENNTKYDGLYYNYSCLPVEYKGGAPFDPKITPKIIEPNVEVPYTKFDEYDEEINKHLALLFKNEPQYSGNVLTLEAFYKYLQKLYGIDFMYNKKDEILNKALIQAVCKGSRWVNFNISESPIIENYVNYPKPYMQKASFRCGKIKVNITSACTPIDNFLGCYARHISLNNGQEEKDFLLFGGENILLADCYTLDNEEWLIFMASNPYYYDGEISPYSIGLHSYFYGLNYIGTYNSSIENSYYYEKTIKYNTNFNPEIKYLEKELKPFEGTSLYKENLVFKKINCHKEKQYLFDFIFNFPLQAFPTTP